MESNKKRVKDFKIIDLIGSGATSNVYIARDQKNGIIGAIKIIKDNYIDDNETIKKYFSREVDATRSLNHENIIKLLDYGTYEHTYFLAYEYIQGVTLDKYIKNKNSIEEIEKISLQILSGLNYAHSKNVVHRDLKPKNIMIDSHGTIKIMDFGISKILDNRDMTKTNLFAGSPGYISPEQADPSIIENQSVDNRADLYSFGILLFELLTNTLPFNSETPWGIIHKHLSEPPPDLKKIKKDVPLYLAEIVAKCLKKNRTERYSTAQEIIEIIEKKEMHETEKNNSDDATVIISKKLVEKPNELKQDKKSGKTYKTFIEIEFFIITFGIFSLTLGLFPFIGFLFHFLSISFLIIGFSTRAPLKITFPCLAATLLGIYFQILIIRAII